MVHRDHNAQAYSAFGQILIKTTSRVWDNTTVAYKTLRTLSFVDMQNSSYPSLPGGNSTTLTMCIHRIYLCGFCQTPVGRYTHPCPPQFQRAPNHEERWCQPYIIRPPEPYSCPNSSCIASSQLHWALRNQQEIAMRQGKAKMNYIPFHEIKAMCGDNDEACHLAIDPVPVTKPKNERVRQAPPAPASVAGYPPTRIKGARLPPDWLSLKEWHKVRLLQSRGQSILDMADAVHVNASKLRTYVDTYLKDASLYGSPLPSANSTNSSNSTTTSSFYSTESSDTGLFPLDQQVTVPQEGMPHPSFLTFEEQQIVWRMFQQNDTVRNMADGLHKNRHKLSQYINAYMRPKLLRLQAKQREDEGAAIPTPIAPLAGGLPPSNLVAPITAASRFPPLLQPVTSQPVAPTAVPGSTSYQEPRLHSAKETELDAFLRLVDPAILTPPPAITDTEDCKKRGGVAHLDTPKSATEIDSLFGDSPVDNNHAGSAQLFSSNHHEVEPSQPATPNTKKRKFEDNTEVQAQPRRASKRLRHRSSL